MKLKKEARLSEFIRAAQKCEGEVTFVTPEGDQLNLKSTLSQFVFSVALGSDLSFHDGAVQCTLPEDYRLLQDYLTEEE